MKTSCVPFMTGTPKMFGMPLGTGSGSSWIRRSGRWTPPDLERALWGAPPAWERWGEMIYTHQREHVEAIEEAKKPETRARRIEKAVRDVEERSARGGRWKNLPPDTGAT